MSKKRSASKSDDYGVSPAEHARLSRPFEPAVWRRAETIAERYAIIIESDHDGGFAGRSVEMPLVMGGGKNVDTCYLDTLKATTLAIATLLERGESPPSPAREGKRDQQVNIRLTADEKLAIEAAANRDGFKSLSDFMRSVSLNRSR